MFVTVAPRFNVKITEERSEKIRRSEQETRNMKFRSVHCPYCESYLFDVFEDIQGHMAVKCNKCKGVVPLNPAYFKRYSELGRKRRKNRNLI